MTPPGRWSRSSSWATAPRGSTTGRPSSTPRPRTRGQPLSTNRSGSPWGIADLAMSSRHRASAHRGSLARAKEALDSRDFRLLTSARIASTVSDGIFQAFLIDRLVFLSPEKGTAIGVAKAYALLVIPFSLLGPFTGVVIDRWSRRRILVFTPLIRAAAALGILVLTSGPASLLLYALSLVVVSLNRFFISTTGAVLPALVPDEDLLMANSITQATGTVLTFAGLVVGTQVADQVGDRGLLVAPLVLWPISAIIASWIGKVLRPAGSRSE